MYDCSTAEQWSERIKITFPIPLTKLVGTARTTVKSQAVKVGSASEEVYLGLEVRAQADPIKVRVYAADPDWSQSEINDLQISLPYCVGGIDSRRDACGNWRAAHVIHLDKAPKIKKLDHTDGADRFYSTPILVSRYSDRYAPQSDDTDNSELPDWNTDSGVDDVLTRADAVATATENYEQRSQYRFGSDLRKACPLC